MTTAASQIIAGGGRRYRLVRALGSDGTWLAVRVQADGTEQEVELALVDQVGPLPPGQVRALAGMSQRLAKARHPGLGVTLDLVWVDGLPGLVSVHKPGAWLAELVEAPLPPTVAVGLASQVSAALAAAHALSPPVVHGALRRDNLWVGPDGQVVVRGFGRAATWATPTPKDDVFALAGLLYGLLTGAALPAPSLGAKQSTAEITSRLAGVPSALGPLIRSGLSPEAAERPTAAALASALSSSPADRAWAAWVAQAFDARARPAPELLALVDVDEDVDAEQPTVSGVTVQTPAAAEGPTQDQAPVDLVTDAIAPLLSDAVTPLTSQPVPVAAPPQKPSPAPSPELSAEPGPGLPSPPPPASRRPQPTSGSSLGRLGALALVGLVGGGVFGWWSFFRSPPGSEPSPVAVQEVAQKTSSQPQAATPSPSIAMPTALANPQPLAGTPDAGEMAPASSSLSTMAGPAAPSPALPDLPPPARVVVRVEGALEVRVSCGGEEAVGLLAASVRDPASAMCSLEAEFDDGFATTEFLALSDAPVQCVRSEDGLGLDCDGGGL